MTQNLTKLDRDHGYRDHTAATGKGQASKLRPDIRPVELWTLPSTPTPKYLGCDSLIVHWFIALLHPISSEV